MICKELDPYTGNDKFSLAGRKAEEQLAFYLRRAFEQDTTVRVFNALRFARNGDAAQIDHLVLHPCGIIIIESKSIFGEVAINEHNEWKRTYAGGVVGMPSPILQAGRQGDFLHALLKENTTRLLDRILGLQKKFGALRIDVLVAISDSGIIHRPKKLPLPGLCKADQVPDRVREIVEHLRRANSFFSLNSKDAVLTLNADNVEKITHFFLEQHCPLTPTGTAGHCAATRASVHAVPAPDHGPGWSSGPATPPAAPFHPTAVQSQTPARQPDPCTPARPLHGSRAPARQPGPCTTARPLHGSQTPARQPGPCTAARPLHGSQAPARQPGPPPGLVHSAPAQGQDPARQADPPPPSGVPLHPAPPPTQGSGWWRDVPAFPSLPESPDAATAVSAGFACPNPAPAQLPPSTGRLPESPQPQSAQSAQPVPVSSRVAHAAAAEMNTVAACKTCASPQVRILYGQYGYYFKCSCGANTKIRVSCQACGERARVRKEGLHFHVDCQRCGHSRPYFTNIE